MLSPALFGALGAAASGGAGAGLGALAPWLLGGGIGLSSLGGIFGASGAGRDARKARDWEAARMGEQYQRNAGSFFGNDNFLNMIYGSQGNGKAADAFTKSIGGPWMDQMRGLAGLASDQSGAIRNGYAAETGRLSGLSGANLAGLASAWKGSTDGLMGAYDKGAGDIMGMADQWGKGREAIIERDASKALTGMNRSTLAQLASTGFGNSTTAGDMLSGNARRVSENTNDAKQALSDSQIGLKTNLARSMLSERSGQGLTMARGWLDALERSGQGQIDREYGRSAGQTNLDSSGLDRILNYRMMPISTGMGVIGNSGGIPSYTPAGASAMGTGLASLGNAGSQIGSMLWMRQLLGG